MYFKKIAITFMLSAFAFEAFAAATHTVAAGDTLYSIASRYQVSLDQLRDLNNLASTQIRQGQRLAIPRAGQSRHASSLVGRYVVRKGDTLSSIADRHKVSVYALKKANALSSSVVKVGQKLVLPSAVASQGIRSRSSGTNVSNISTNSSEVYIIKSGDTLSGISSTYGVGLTALASANRLSLNKPLREGQRIVIPVANMASSSAAPVMKSAVVTPVRAAAFRSVRLESSSAIVVDAETGKVLFAKNIDTVRPIASITKLMTAMVVLDAKLPLMETLSIGSADVDSLKHTTSRLPVGVQLTRYEMLRLALMSSENRASSALARHYPGGRSAFIKAMNNKARQLGMSSTKFHDSTGLTPHNTSTASDLVKMVEASSHYDLIHKFTTTEDRQVAIHPRRSPLQFMNSNVLVRNGQWDIDVSKTGFINEAGRCLVMKADVARRPSVMVLLDSDGKYSPVGDANRIKKWIESGASGIKLASL